MVKIKYWLLLALLFSGSVANAVEWDVQPTIAVAVTYTDNLELGSDPVKDGELVTEILPAVKIVASGKRLNGTLDYKMQNLNYTEKSEFDESINYAAAKGTVALVGKSLFLDFFGRQNQQILNPGGSVAISGVSRSNRTGVGQYTINPYLQRKIGRSGVIKMGYQVGRVDYEKTPENNSDSSGSVVSISVAPPRSPWSLRINGTDSTIEYDSGSSVDLQRVGGELAWAVGPDTAIFISGGDEDNQFSQQIPGRPKIDGAFWNVGLRGRIDRQTTYSLSVGEQHFGDSYEFSLLREAGKLTTDIRYFEETTTVGRQQQDYEALFEFLTDITGVELPEAGPEVYVRKRFSGIANLELARSKVRVNAYNEGRTYLTIDQGNSDGVAGIAASWTWTALERTQFSVAVGWQRFEIRRNDTNPEDVRLQVRYKRDLKGGVFLNVRAWHNRRAGATASGEYDENAISVGVGKSF